MGKLVEKMKIGIIGCGGIANGKHLPSIKEIDKMEIVAVCDLIEERAVKAKEEYGTEETLVFTDYKELLKIKEIVSIYVLTPNRSHSVITIDALHADKNVICEKPMAINTAEAQKMLDTAKETGKILTIGYQNRYRADSTYIKAACDNGDLGDIYYGKAHAVRRRAVPTWGVFLNEAEQGGGPLIDIGTHSLDLALWMMNNYEPESVMGSVYHKLANQTNTANAFGEWDPKEFTVEDSAMGYIKMKNGATINLEASWALNTLDVDEAKTSLCGTKAGADMKDGVRINCVKYNKQVVETPAIAGTGVAFFDGEVEKDRVIEQEVFYNAVMNGGELVVKPEQAIVVTKILEAIYESAKTGKAVYFD